MSTNIECTQCGDAVSVEARSVTLPFVCMECEKAVEEFEDETQQYEDMAPAVDGYYSPDGSVDVTDNGDGSVTLSSAVATAEPADEAPFDPEPLSDEFATVENTTLLIEDLEQQLSSTALSLEAAHVTISTLQEENDNLLVEVNGLEFQLNKAKEYLVELSLQALLGGHDCTND